MPDYHGQIDGPTKFDMETYERRLLIREEIPYDAFWAKASKAGRRVAVIDVPYVLLEKDINGVQVADWLTHVRTMPEELACIPNSMAARIDALYGRNPFRDRRCCPTDALGADSVEEIIAFRDSMRSRIDNKGAFSAQLLAEGPWDLFITVFHEAHDTGHKCWHVHDPDHEQHDRAVVEAVGDPLLDVYEALDRNVGRLVEAAPSHATVLVYLSHGIGPERTAMGFLDDILEAIERLAARPKGAPVDLLRRIYRNAVPGPLRHRIAGTTVAAKAYHQAEKSKQMRRRCFEQTPNRATGGVRLNLAGRERHGIVEPGPESARLIEHLLEAFSEITNADTGAPLVESATLTSEIYSGPMRNALPDILLEWNKAAPIERVHSPRFGILQNRHRRLRTGDHVQKRGAVLVRAPNVSPGSHCPISVVDLAPTILHLLDVETHGRRSTLLDRIA
jgi:predicted AlkP superfamily phosphohydrolase/phosphomutase